MEINNTTKEIVQQPKFITVDEMTKLLGVAKATAYQLTKVRDFPCFYIGKRIMIPSQAFNEWIEQQATAKSTIL